MLKRKLWIDELKNYIIYHGYIDTYLAFKMNNIWLISLVHKNLMAMKCSLLVPYINVEFEHG